MGRDQRFNVSFKRRTGEHPTELSRWRSRWKELLFIQPTGMAWTSLSFRVSRSGGVCERSKAAAAPCPLAQADRRLSRPGGTHREHTDSLSLSRSHWTAPVAGTSTHRAETQSPFQLLVLRPIHTHALPSVFPCLFPKLPQSLLLIFGWSLTSQKESCTIPRCLSLHVPVGSDPSVCL